MSFFVCRSLGLWGMCFRLDRSGIHHRMSLEVYRKMLIRKICHYAFKHTSTLHLPRQTRNFQSFIICTWVSIPPRHFTNSEILFYVTGEAVQLILVLINANINIAHKALHHCHQERSLVLSTTIYSGLNASLLCMHFKGSDAWFSPDGQENWSKKKTQEELDKPKCRWVLHMQICFRTCKTVVVEIMVLISQIEIDLCLNDICCVKTEARELIWLDF